MISPISFFFIYIIKTTRTTVTARNKWMTIIERKFHLDHETTSTQITIRKYKRKWENNVSVKEKLLKR
jgi:hypothetical protein